MQVAISSVLELLNIGNFEKFEREREKRGSS